MSRLGIIIPFIITWLQYGNMYSLSLDSKKADVGDVAGKQEAGPTDAPSDTDVYCMNYRYQLHPSDDIPMSAPLDRTHEISVDKR